MTVIKAPRANGDLVSIHNYIADANKSRVNADRFMQRLDEEFELIATQPRMGRIRDDLQLGLRSQPFDKYLILYRPSGEGIEVARVIHAARDVESLFH